MVRINDLKLSLRVFMKAYRWRVIDPVPLARLTKAVSDCRVAVVTSAGLVVPGDEPFNDKVKGGDFSFRVIPSDTDIQSLEEHHRSDAFDHSGVEADRNVALPLERLREMADSGEIGSVAPRHISLMGSITAPGRLVKRTVPVVGEMMVEDAVDVALLVPV
jgi:D-proline reductase (dithiol) PrdB